MPTYRRKISTVYNEFLTEINRLERYDRENQSKFSLSIGSPTGVKLSKRQLHMLTEAIFFTGFRAYENFLRDIFLLYCLEKTPRSNIPVNSFLRPHDFQHAEELIQSSMRFLDWANPSETIDRAEIYLSNGFPIKIPISSNKEILTDYKRIRNHIAHNSKKSLDDYKRVLRNHLGSIPLIIPLAGEFLLYPEKSNANKYKLLSFFDLMKKIAFELT